MTTAYPDGLLTFGLGHCATSSHHCCLSDSVRPPVYVGIALHPVRGYAVLGHVQLAPLQPEHTLPGWTEGMAAPCRQAFDGRYDAGCDQTAMAVTLLAA